MFARLVAHGVAVLVVALAGCAAKDVPLDFEAVPPAHVAAAGEALDPSAAYVVIVPHLQNRLGARTFLPYPARISKRTVREFSAWLSTAPALGSTPATLRVDVPTDRPTVVRLPAGRYFVAKVFVASLYYEVDADYSLFDARPGQLNYPGDWTVETGFHEISRGARPIGWYFNATLLENGGSDSGALVADARGAIAQLPVVYTRRPPTRPAPGEH